MAKKTPKKTPVKKRTTPWRDYALSELPEDFFRKIVDGNQILSPEEALTLPPYYAALRLYQTSVSNLPCKTYQRSDNGRTIARHHAAYKLLNERPNPAMSRAAFFELLVNHLFQQGESFNQIQWSANNKPLNLFPIERSRVTDIEIHNDWTKTYILDDGKEKLQDFEMIHIVGPMCKNFRGIPFFQYAAESLTLHRQILESANAYYNNAARPSVYVSFPGAVGQQAIDTNKKNFNENYAGSKNRGKVACLTNGGELKAYPGSTAEEAQIIQALNAATLCVAQWFGLSPLTLGDLTRGTYSNAGADNLAFYQKSLAPLLNKIQMEFNYKLFGVDADYYAEFVVQKILEADPAQQADIYQKGINAGYLLRSEVREWMNLPAVKGLDKPVLAVNLAHGDFDERAVPETVNEDQNDDQEQEQQETNGPDTPAE